ATTGESAAPGSVCIPSVRAIRFECAVLHGQSGQAGRVDFPDVDRPTSPKSASTTGGAVAALHVESLDVHILERQVSCTGGGSVWRFHGRTADGKQPEVVHGCRILRPNRRAITLNRDRRIDKWRRGRA